VFTLETFLNVKLVVRKVNSRLSKVKEHKSLSAKYHTELKIPLDIEGHIFMIYIT